MGTELGPGASEQTNLGLLLGSPGTVVRVTTPAHELGDESRRRALVPHSESERRAGGTCTHAADLDLLNALSALNRACYCSNLICLDDWQTRCARQGCRCTPQASARG